MLGKSLIFFCAIGLMQAHYAWAEIQFSAMRTTVKAAIDVLSQKKQGLKDLLNIKALNKINVPTTLEPETQKNLKELIESLATPKLQESTLSNMKQRVRIAKLQEPVDLLFSNAFQKEDLNAMVAALLLGADPNTLKEEKKDSAEKKPTPLQSVAKKGDPEMIFILLKLGARPNSIGNEPGTPLARARKARCEACVDILVNFGGK